MVNENLFLDDVMQAFKANETDKCFRTKLLKDEALKSTDYHFTCIPTSTWKFWDSNVYNKIGKKVWELYYRSDVTISKHISSISDEFYSKLYEEDEIGEKSEERLYLLTSAAISYGLNSAIRNNKTFGEACKYLKKNLIIKCMEKYLEISESNINETLFWQQLFN